MAQKLRAPGSILPRRGLKSAAVSTRGVNIYYICSNHNRTGECTRHSTKEETIRLQAKDSLNAYLERYRTVLERISKLDVRDITINADFASLEKEKEKYERLRQSLYMDLEDELITTEEFDRYRKNYLVKIKQADEQISQKQELVRDLEKRLKDKDGFISNIIPSESIEELSRVMLVTFIDKVEVSEDGSLHFIYNHIETVNLLEKIAEKEQVQKVKESTKTISLHETFTRLEPAPSYAAVGGGI